LTLPTSSGRFGALLLNALARAGRAVQSIARALARADARAGGHCAPAASAFAHFAVAASDTRCVGAEVREYFNNEGFNRWNKIYSESDEVNVVQKFIRSGHQETVDKCLRWIDEDGSAARELIFGCVVCSRVRFPVCM